MQQPFYLIIFVLLHALCVLQPVLSLPTTLVRRVNSGDLRPQRYTGFAPTPHNPTFYAKDTIHPGLHLTPQQIDEAAKRAYLFIRHDHLLPQNSPHFPKNMVVAALYVPRKNAIYYASQPLGAGRAFYIGQRGPHVWPGKNSGWPGLLSEQESMHAEGHAVYMAYRDGATSSDFQGSYIGIYGHFDGGMGQKIPPCRGVVDDRTHCNALLRHMKITHS